MEYRPLGQSALTISRIGFGCAPASGYDYGPIDEQEWSATVRLALDHGINFFDVADVYGFGRAEELLAGALGERRRDVVIATKCGLAWNACGKVRRDLSRPSVVSALEASLRRLRLDSIPLYQIHWPDPAVPIEQVMETLAACKAAGKIQAIGIGNCSFELLKRAYPICRFESHQAAFNLLAREPEESVFPWCEEMYVSNIAHSALARGFLAGRQSINGFHPVDTRRNSPYFSGCGQTEKQRVLDAIREVSAKTGRPMPSVAIRWILDHPHVTSTLVGFKNRQQAGMALEAIGWRLSPDGFARLACLSAACPGGLAGTPAHATT